jgi:hypothetical protein
MPRQKCPNKCENEKECPCEEIDCVRHGICCECVAYHREHPEDGKPACME